MATIPIEHFSVLQKTNFFELLGWRASWPHIPITLQLSLNLHTPIKIDPGHF